ncbi:LysR family transcriptional regulator [Trinickia sp. Y13]|uniref:LysR family transcriptional regulator n=1 Tax=Trinickia sp. Y13 TaxID=2917807 RepID=UPI0024051504|nr:LysR family transcriptional regulator [Trinickia sp. Y13]MDG0025511.1 LysR family transcriptional regulator [Trinickia sp. Y13]
MRASLRQIETFYWVARLGGFHAAARRLHLTQPTISARIHELEEVLGSKLFERGAYRTELTALGGRLLAQAEKILRLADDFGDAARATNPFRGLLRLGTNESTAMSGLIDMLTQLKARYPSLRVELTIDIGSALSRKLNGKELDVAILMEPVSAPGIVDIAIGRAPLCWVAAARFAPPRATSTPADLVDLPIVLTPPPSTLFGAAAEWFRAGGVSLDNYSTCNSISLITQLVAAGHAIAALPRSIVQADVDRGMLQYLVTRPALAPRTYYIAYPRDEENEDSALLVQMARAVLAQYNLFEPLTD